MPQRILIADDDADTAESFAILLRHEGFDVRCAYDGPGALSAIRDWAPDAACIDLAMPGMDGFEVAWRVERDPCRAPVLLAVTGLSGADVAARCARAGFAEHLVKPIEPEALLDSLRRWTVDGAPEANHEFLAGPIVAGTDWPEQALDAAIAVGRADFGTLQLVDEGGVLRIRAQRGFEAPFLRHFAAVSIGSGSACGAALRGRRQVFVRDTAESPIFGTADRVHLVSAGVRSVVSSPACDATGNVRGVVSCHYRAVTAPGAVNLPAHRLVARRVSQQLG